MKICIGCQDEFEPDYEEQDFCEDCLVEECQCGACTGRHDDEDLEDNCE